MDDIVARLNANDAKLTSLHIMRFRRCNEQVHMQLLLCLHT